MIFLCHNADFLIIFLSVHFSKYKFPCLIFNIFFCLPDCIFVCFSLYLLVIYLFPMDNYPCCVCRLICKISNINFSVCLIVFLSPISYEQLVLFVLVKIHNYVRWLLAISCLDQSTLQLSFMSWIFNAILAFYFFRWFSFLISFSDGEAVSISVFVGPSVCR